MSLDLNFPIRHHLFRHRFTELNEIYYFMAMRSFALTMVTIFIPIYLYELKYGISNIFLFYISLYLTEMLCEYPTSKFIKKRGPKHSMVISLPFLILHIWQLFTMNTYHWSPLVLALPVGFSLAFFWQGYHYDFSRSKHISKATKEVGKSYIMLTMISATAPLIGGFIATFFGFQALLFIIMILLIIGSVILFQTKDTNFRTGDFKIKRLPLKEIKNDLISYAGLGWESVTSMTIWPLFLFLIIGSYYKLGILASLTLVVSIFTTYWVSKRADKNKRIQYIKTGGLLNSLIGVVQIFVDSITQAFAVNLGRSFAQSLFKPTYDSEYYLHADEESRSEYIFAMESMVDFSRLIYYLILFVASLYFPLPILLIAGLVLGIFGSALVPLMPPAKCEICGPIRNKKIRLNPRPALK